MEWTRETIVMWGALAIVIVVLARMILEIIINGRKSDRMLKNAFDQEAARLARLRKHQ